MLWRTRRSRLVVDVPASEPGGGIDGGLDLRGVGRCDDASVVRDRRIESIRYLSVIVGSGPVSEIFRRKFAGRQYRKCPN
jgi:hypothetical protein